MSRGAGASAAQVSDDLARRLQGLTRAVSPEEMDELWIFPPLSDVEDSAEFLLFTRRMERERRLLYTARLALGAAHGVEGAADGNGAPGPSGNGAPGRGGNGHGSAAAPARDAGPRQEITEHGSVPSGRVHRIVDRFRRRLEDEGEPVHVVIDGRRERWTDLVDGG